MPYFKTRWEHGLLCWRHARRHRVVAVALVIISGYTALTTWGPLINLPDYLKVERLPKIPLPWAIVAMLAAIIFVLIEGSFRLHGTSESFRKPSWETIAGRSFTNEAIEVDGKRFVDCKFRNTKFVFHGNQPTDFRGNTVFDGSLELTTDHPAAIHYLEIESKLTSIPGSKFERSARDQNGDVVPSALKVTGHSMEEVSLELLSACQGLNFGGETFLFFSCVLWRRATGAF